MKAIPTAGVAVAIAGEIVVETTETAAVEIDVSF